MAYCAGIVASLALVIPAFYTVEPLAGLLMLPYLAWGIFAMFLNSTLINLNPQVCSLDERNPYMEKIAYMYCKVLHDMIHQSSQDVSNPHAIHCRR